MCSVAFPCCLFDLDLACFFLSSFSSLIKTCTYNYVVSLTLSLSVCLCVCLFYSFAATKNELHEFSPTKEPLLSMLEGEIQTMYMCKPGEGFSVLADSKTLCWP